MEFGRRAARERGSPHFDQQDTQPRDKANEPGS